ncbi:MAG: hypothetical protein K2Q26_08725 [Bdellovibrionales bacterium]|nr:hypothetical protein [Bdellovibrionales bacterium]
MKIFAVLFLMSFASQAYAISDETLVQRCLEVGRQKVAAQAEAWGCVADVKNVEVQKIDNRWYNPVKYVWYQVRGECNGYSEVIQLVQYYKGKCF